MAGMVTRYLNGGSLHDLITRSREESGEGLPVEDILRLSIELAYGLAHIHQRRILYLDLQPRNVLFDEWGTIHLVDFDTAVSLDDHEVTDLSRRAVINYTAPELMDGVVADESADLYSLGATIYEMTAGRRPSVVPVRRYWLRARWTWLPLSTGKVFPTGCGILYSVCLLPSLSNGQPVRLTSQDTWKAFARLMLRSNAFSPAL